MHTKIQITADCADAAELVAAGATELEIVHEDGGTFTVLHDPEHNEFGVQ